MAFNISKIIGGVSDTLSMVNKAIPIYKQVSPIIKNVRSAFSSVSSVKEAIKSEEIKEAQNFVRPKTILKKKTYEDRGNFNLDTLTFFQ